MAKFQVGKGLDEYIANLGNLEFRTPEIVGKAIFDGAKIVADQIRANIEALPVQSGPVKRNERREPTQVEKDGMLASLGVAKMQNDGGFYNVKIGMDGYNAAKPTEKYPRGKANAMVARSINAGTTWVNRHPFINQAVNQTKALAEEAMKNRIEQDSAEIMNN